MLYSSFEEYFFMADLSVEYLGLELRNPVVIASSPLTGDIGHLKACQEKGAGAVVLKSIFQEQIDRQIDKEILENEQYLNHGDAASYYEAVSRDYYLDKYLSLVREAKKELGQTAVQKALLLTGRPLSSSVRSARHLTRKSASKSDTSILPLPASSSRWTVPVLTAWCFSTGSTVLITGIHDGQTVIKMLLAGAACTQVCTAAMKDLGVIEAMCETLSSWMDRHGFKSIGDFKGRLAQENMANGSLWERTQYIRKLSGER